MFHRFPGYGKGWRFFFWVDICDVCGQSDGTECWVVEVPLQSRGGSRLLPRGMDELQSMPVVIHSLTGGRRMRPYPWQVNVIMTQSVCTN